MVALGLLMACMRSVDGVGEGDSDVGEIAYLQVKEPCLVGPAGSKIGYGSL